MGEWINGCSDRACDSAAKRSAIAIDLEVAGSGPVSCCLSIPSLSLPCVVLYLVFHWHCHGA